MWQPWLILEKWTRKTSFISRNVVGNFKLGLFPQFFFDRLCLFFLECELTAVFCNFFGDWPERERDTNNHFLILKIVFFEECVLREGKTCATTIYLLSEGNCIFDSFLIALRMKIEVPSLQFFFNLGQNATSSAQYFQIDSLKETGRPKCIALSHFDLAFIWWSCHPFLDILCWDFWSWREWCSKQGHDDTAMKINCSKPGLKMAVTSIKWQKRKKRRGGTQFLSETTFYSFRDLSSFLELRNSFALREKLFWVSYTLVLQFCKQASSKFN